MNDNVGANIKTAREAAGLSQATLADGLMSTAHLSLIEAGKRSPSAKMLESLAAKLHVDIELLLHGVDGRAMAAHLDELGQRMAAPDEAVDFATLLLGDRAFCRDEHRRARALYMRGIAQERLGQVSDAIDDLNAAIALLPGDFAPAEILQLGVDAVRNFRTAGRFDAALETALKFVASVPNELTGSAVHARLLSTTVGCYYYLDRHQEGFTLVTSSLPLFDAAISGEGRGYILWNGISVCVGLGDHELATRWGEEALELLAPLDLHPNMIAMLKTNLGTAHRKVAVPNLERAAQLLREAYEALVHVGNLPVAGAAQTELAFIAWMQGDLREASRQSAESLNTLKPFGDTVHLVDALHTRARIEASLGNSDELRTAIANATAVESEHESTGIHAAAWRALGDDLRKLGRTDEALICLERALFHAHINA